jgi:ubiquinone/menaquinone biosynthesis C-methylase UbiE
VICIDIVPGPGIDLVADAQNLDMIASDSVDCALVVSLLPHVRYPDKVIAEVHRILRPGGVVYASVPFVFPLIGEQYDNYRFSYPGLAILCEEFELIANGFNRGPASTMQQLLVHFMALLFSFNNKVAYGVSLYIFRWLFFWIKYLDKLIAHHKLADRIYSGAYFLGRKPHHVHQNLRRGL